MAVCEINGGGETQTVMVNYKVSNCWYHNLGGLVNQRHLLEECQTWMLPSFTSVMAYTPGRCD